MENISINNFFKIIPSHCMKLLGIFLFSLFTTSVVFSQKLDTTFYNGQRIQMIYKEELNKTKVLTFLTKEGENLIEKNTFDYTCYSDKFENYQTIKIENKCFIEQYMVNGSDTIYLYFNKDKNFDSQALKFSMYLKKNIKYPKDARKAEQTGVAYISFVINKNGYINKVKADSYLGYGLEEEGIRVVKSYSNYGIVTHNGKPINAYLRLPLRFKLRNSFFGF